MPFDTSSRPNRASIGEKVARLSEFVAGEPETQGGRDLQAAANVCLVIARSPRSPVAQALRNHARMLAAAGVTIRAIFGEIQSTDAMGTTSAFPGECRVIRDPRLLAAHEQLVLPPDRTWIGDCMRREPSRRDTYERFAVSAPETAAMAARSFEQLWRAAVPVQTMPAVPAALASQLPGLARDRLGRSESFRRQ